MPARMTFERLMVLLRPLALAAVLALLGAAALHGSAAAQNSNVRPPSSAVNQGTPTAPDTAQVNPSNYDIEIWQKIRQSAQGTVSIPDKKSGLLVQSDGEEWRALRTSALPQWGGYAMAATLAALAAFYLLRGRINIEHGLAGRTITRFSSLERTAHWLMAVSFIIQGVTGLNALYGRDVVMPLIGKEAFASLSMTAKWLHGYVAFAFMVGLLLSFLLWVRHNVPGRHDVTWLAQGGGMFSRGSHPPAKKFNAGQKILFWMIMLCGASLSLSGLSLLLPFEFSLFEKTFAILNAIGFNLPATLTPVQEMQYAVTWHSIIALALVCVIFAHIYIGTIGMEGAFDAMGSGEVDLNWAKEHHSLWVEEELEKEKIAPRGSPARVQPAE